MKPLKQKQVVSAPVCNISFGITKDISLIIMLLLFFDVFFSQVDGVSYLLQEIYGIENKYNSQESKVGWRDISVCFALSSSQAMGSGERGNHFPLIVSVFHVHRLPMTRSVTTAPSVWCVCRTCETHSSCRAGICVSVTPAQTHCATRPTAAPSAGCVSPKTHT